MIGGEPNGSSNAVRQWEAIVSQPESLLLGLAAAAAIIAALLWVDVIRAKHLSKDKLNFAAGGTAAALLCAGVSWFI